MIVCRDYLECCGVNLIHYAFKLLFYMYVYHLETSARVDFGDLPGFLYHRLLLELFDSSRCAELYLPGDTVQEIHALHIEEINPYR